MIGSVPSTSSDALLNPAKSSKLSTSDADSGAAFGAQLEQSLNRRAAEKVDKNQASDRRSAVSDSTKQADPATKPDKATAASADARKSTESDASAAAQAEQADAAGKELSLPPGKALPLVASIQEALNQADRVASVAQPEGVPAVLGHPVAGGALAEMLGEHTPSNALAALASHLEASEDQSDNELVSAVSEELAADAAALGSVLAAPSEIVEKTTAVSNRPVAVSELKLAQSAPQTTPAASQSVDELLSGLRSGLNPVAATLSESQPFQSQPQGIAQHAANALTAALDKMPDQAAQKVESLTPFALASAQVSDQAESDVATQLRLDRPMTHMRWATDLGERVQWLVNRAMNGAEIRLNPPQLGPVEVRIHMQQDQASVAFAAQHASVREAIEAAIPKLREMLGQQSLNLVNVDISQHSFAEQRQQGGLPGDSQGSARNTFTSDESDWVETGAEPIAGPVYEGLINTYA